MKANTYLTEKVIRASGCTLELYSSFRSCLLKGSLVCRVMLISGSCLPVKTWQSLAKPSRRSPVKALGPSPTPARRRAAQDWCGADLESVCASWREERKTAKGILVLVFTSSPFAVTWELYESMFCCSHTTCKTRATKQSLKDRKCPINSTALFAVVLFFKILFLCQGLPQVLLVCP